MTRGIPPADDDRRPDSACRRIDTAHNLLLGLLALQNHFIDRDALVGAFDSWVADRSRGLGQNLVERGALSPMRRQLLEALVEEHIRLHGDDPEKSLAALGSIGAVRHDLSRVADPDLQDSLAHVTAARTDDHDPDRTATFAGVGDSTSAGTRFRILRPHAKGGLGELFIAHDAELNRDVALKEIQDQFADDPGHRARFEFEAEVTGGLEHPGIVPVYGLGRTPNGRPFYAMRFIKGNSLKEAVRRFHEAEKQSRRDPGLSTLELRELLGRFIDVCDAVAYAHSRRVLHRDLKPGNIMLGKYGETLVVDWGLAKSLDEPESESSTERSELPLKPASGSAVEPTLAGSALGTPAYMSPEQVDGRVGKLGVRSDVYCLGATLYHLLTGRAPCEAGQVGEVYQKVLAGEILRPRSLNPRIASALEAICLKALALAPRDRYESAEVLKVDLERWLADEPVTAWREPLAMRARRWARRHRTSMGIAATVLLAIATGGPIAIALIRERGLRRQAEVASARANELLGVAQSFLDKTVETVVSDNPSTAAAVPIPVRKDVAQRVIPYYDKLIALKGDDIAAQAGVANTLLARAKLRHALGTPEEDRAAVADCLEAADLYAKAAKGPDNDFGHGQALLALGAIFGPQGQFPKAITYLTQARPVLERLVTEHPDRTEYRFALAKCLSNEANCHRFLGDQQQQAKSNVEAAREYQSAEGAYTEAVRQARELVRQSPAEPRFVEWLSRISGNIGELQLSRGDISAATKTESAGHALRRAKEIALDLDRKLPNVASIQECLATATLNYADYLKTEGQLEAAFSEFDQVRIAYDRFHLAHPGVQDFRWGQAMARKALGEVLLAQKKPGEARTVLEEAARQYDLLVADYPQVQPFAEERNQLREILSRLGQGTGSIR